jgi:hypothetical protein
LTDGNVQIVVLKSSILEHRSQANKVPLEAVETLALTDGSVVMVVLKSSILRATVVKGRQEQ